MSRHAGPFEIYKCGEEAACEELAQSSIAVAGGPTEEFEDDPSQSNHRTANQSGAGTRQKVVPLFTDAPLYTYAPDGGAGTAGDPEQTAPERHYDCGNYDTCLSLAAALDWHSFSCSGCSGAVNRKLLWRAHHMLRQNSSLRKICKLPVLY